jgi:hypothetical protein
MSLARILRSVKSLKDLARSMQLEEQCEGLEELEECLSKAKDRLD